MCVHVCYDNMLEGQWGATGDGKEEYPLHKRLNRRNPRYVSNTTGLIMWKPTSCAPPPMYRASMVGPLFLSLWCWLVKENKHTAWHHGVNSLDVVVVLTLLLSYWGRGHVRNWWMKIDWDMIVQSPEFGQNPNKAAWPADDSAAHWSFCYYISHHPLLWLNHTIF